MRDGLPGLEDGRVMDVPNAVWCTGFRPDFGWIELPVIGQDDQPVHRRGIVDGQPGLYFVGLFFLSASSLIGGVGRDAAHIADHIASRQADGREPDPDRSRLRVPMAGPGAP